jgi:DNA-directed RNA polymerase specialized sigma24 family protein
MNQWRDEMVGTVLVQAREFLYRWRDPATRSECDDLAQDVALLAWRSKAAVRDRACFPAMVRTISRRVRWQALERLRGERALTYECELAAQHVPEPSLGAAVRIRGEVVPMDWMLEQLDSALECVGRLNRQLLLLFYEGYGCCELAHRFGLREDTVKMRLFRSRLRLREEFEVRARAAGYLVD